MKQGLKKLCFCKDSYYEMDDHTLRYHVLTGNSVPENKVDGVISNLMGVKKLRNTKNHMEFHGFRQSSLNPMDLERSSEPWNIDNSLNLIGPRA